MEWRSTMVEQAKEELQILETQHPNRFEYLKAELKSFIFLLQSQDLLLSTPTNSTSPTATSTATTQASSTLKKRKKEGSSETGRSKQKMRRADYGGETVNGRWDRVEAVIERAQACLRKIQHFKTGF